MVEELQDKIEFLGIESSPVFVRQPESNGVAERVIKTLKEQLLWFRHFPSIEALRKGLARSPISIAPRGCGSAKGTRRPIRSGPNRRPLHPKPPRNSNGRHNRRSPLSHIRAPYIEVNQRLFACLCISGALDRPSAATPGLRSFHDTKSRKCQIRCTMQVCTTVYGNAAVMASGKPFRPSTTAIRMSAIPRFLSSFITRSENFAPSTCSIQSPRLPLAPEGRMPNAIYTALLRTKSSLRILTPMASKKTKGMTASSGRFTTTSGHRVFFCSPDRKGEHPRAHLKGFTGILHADGYAGFNPVFETGRVTGAACWAHVRRKFLDEYATNPSPITTEALDRIGALYGIEDTIRGCHPMSEDASVERRPHRFWRHRGRGSTQPCQSSRPSQISPRPCVIPSAAELLSIAMSVTATLRSTTTLPERSIRGIALGRKKWLFAGSNTGGERAAAAV